MGQVVTNILYLYLNNNSNNKKKIKIINNNNNNNNILIIVGLIRKNIYLQLFVIDEDKRQHISISL